DRPRELVIRSGQSNRDQVTIAVQDSGVGIEPGDLEQLFNPFFSTKPGGMGMGLSISRSIIQAHGGQLSGISNTSHGACFYISLPGGRPPVPGDRSDARDREQDPDRARAE